MKEKFLIRINPVGLWKRVARAYYHKRMTDQSFHATVVVRQIFAVAAVLVALGFLILRQSQFSFPAAFANFQ